MSPEQELAQLELEQLEAEQADEDKKAQPPAPQQGGEETPLLQSLGKGIRKGGSFGFNDELGGGVQALLELAKSHDWGKAKETYKLGRDGERFGDKKAQQDNPKTFMGGEVLGGLAAPVPGFGLVGGAGKTAATLGKTMAMGGVSGGLTGLGNSEADSVSGMLSDTADGAALGAASGKLAHGVGEGLGYLAKKVSLPGQNMVKKLTQSVAEDQQGVSNRVADAERLLDAKKDLHLMVNTSGPATSPERVAAMEKAGKFGFVPDETELLRKLGLADAPAAEIVKGRMNDGVKNLALNSATGAAGFGGLGALLGHGTAGLSGAALGAANVLRKDPYAQAAALQGVGSLARGGASLTGGAGKTLALDPAIIEMLSKYLKGNDQ